MLWPMPTIKSELLAVADELGLSATAETLRQFQVTAPFDRDATPVAPEAPSSDLPGLLVQLTRRGLDPRLVPTLLGHFEGRPLEKGLVAWDVLCGSLWPSGEDELFAELREAAEAIGEVSGSPQATCVDFNQHPSRALLERHALAAVQDPIEEAKRNGLGAIERLRQQGGKATETVLGLPFRQGLTSLGQLLAQAHLPSLASLYLDYVVRVLGHGAAVPLLCETMLDERASARIPADLIKQSDQSPEDWADFLEYLLYRSHDASGNSVKAYGVLETNRKNRGATPPTDRFVVVRGLLAPEFDDPPPPFEQIDRIAQGHQLWRLAWSVRMASSAAESELASLRPLEVAEDFVRRFGHQWKSWYHAFRVATRVHGGGVPWKIAACASVGQEVLALPHDPHAWKALVLLTAEDDSVNETVEEIDEQLVDQTDF